jgi:putative flippase GtrA
MNNLDFTAERRKTLVEFIRFSIVGIVSTLLCYSLYLLMTNTGVMPKLVMSLVYFFNAVLCFLCNWWWVFANDQNFLNAGRRYFFSQLIGYLLNLMVLEIVADQLGYPHQLAQALGMLLVGVFLFTAFKYYVFPPK